MLPYVIESDRELGMQIANGPTQERRVVAGALLSQLLELTAPFLAAFPPDPLLPNEEYDPATEVGRAIGLALAAGRRAMTSGDPAQANGLGFLRGLGLSYGEWLRGTDQLTIEVTEEYFTDGVARGLLGQVTQRDQPSGQESGFAELAKHTIYTASEDLFVIADHRGLTAQEAARLQIQAFLNLSALFAKQAGLDATALQAELRQASDDALAI